jgi:hypothetical protein
MNEKSASASRVSDALFQSSGRAQKLGHQVSLIKNWVQYWHLISRSSRGRFTGREAEVVCNDECAGWTLIHWWKSVVDVSTWGFPEVGPESPSNRV